MKYFIAIALIVAVASAGVHRPAPSSEIEQIVAAINSPSTDPATAVALEAMLHDLLGTSPIAVGPAIVEPIAVHPIAVGPAIVEPIAVHPIAVGPAIVEPIAVHPIAVGPAIVEPIAVHPISVGPAIVDNDVVPVMPVVEPAEEVVAPAVEAASSPLVQIIINVQRAEDIASVVTSPVLPVPSPVVEEVFVPGPVNVVDTVDVMPVVEPIQVVTPVVPGPVNVVDTVDVMPVVEPVQVVTPVIVNPVQVAAPVVPGPVSIVDSVDVVEPVQVATPVIPEMAVNPIDSLN